MEDIPENQKVPLYPVEVFLPSGIALGVKKADLPFIYDVTDMARRTSPIRIVGTFYDLTDDDRKKIKEEGNQVIVHIPEGNFKGYRFDCQVKGDSFDGKEKEK